MTSLNLKGLRVGDVSFGDVDHDTKTTYQNSSEDGLLKISFTAMDMLRDGTFIVSWTEAEILEEVQEGDPGGEIFPKVSIEKGEKNLVVFSLAHIDSQPAVSVEQE